MNGLPPEPHIDTALVHRLIAAQVPQWAALPVTPVRPGGWDNRTFRLGPDLSVRLPSAARYAPQIEKEHRWLPVLAPLLPVAIPEEVAAGVPGAGYPFAWSVRRWLEGAPLSEAPDTDPVRMAGDLAVVLAALHRIPVADGPGPGAHNFGRGGPLSRYGAEVEAALAALGDHIERRGAATVWQAALACDGGVGRAGPAVWLHGDVAPGNLLVRRGRLAAVIDWGTCGTGDPACDLAMAWTWFRGASQQRFRAALPLDPGTWARARGWALWKALITLAGTGGSDPARRDAARIELDAVLAHDLTR